MKKIAILLLTTLLFFSCEWWEADRIAYLDYYSSTAVIDRHDLDGSYPSVGGITQISSGSSKKIQFVMINPQQYDLIGTLTWHNAPLGGVPVEYGKHYTLEQIQYNIFELTFTNDFLTAIDTNPDLGNISGTIGISEKETGRSFESYSYMLMVNSPPPAVSNAQFAKATINGKETWWLSFNAPENTGIHTDINGITIDGTVYDYADARFITTAPVGLKDRLGNNFTLTEATQRYVNTGLASNVDASRTISVSDSRGLSTAVTINTGDIPLVMSPTIHVDGALDFVTGNKIVSISTSISGTTIYFTTNGSTPTTASTRYSTPFSINLKDSSVTVKAIAIKTGMKNSSVAMQEFEQVTQVSIPTIIASEADGGGNISVTISTVPSDATIFYTTDGSIPATSVTGSTQLYTGTIPLNVKDNGITVKAIAIKEGLIHSSIATKDITQANKVAITIDVSEPDSRGYRTVTISTVPEEATIYYAKGGAEPNTSSTQYTNPFSEDVNTSAVTVKAMAIKAGMIDSDVAEKLVPLADAVNTPVFASPYTVPSGAELTLSTTTPGATIYYTTGSSDFSAGDWLVYSEGSKPTIDFTSGVTSITYRAIASATNLADSAIVEQIYTQAEIENSSIAMVTPTFSSGHATASETWGINNGVFAGSAVTSTITLHADESIGIPDIVTALENAITVSPANATVSVTTAGNADLGVKTFTATLTATGGYVFAGGSATKEIPITFTVKKVIGTTTISTIGISPPVAARAGLDGFTITNFGNITSGVTASFVYDDITETDRQTAIAAAVNQVIGSTSSLPTGVAPWTNIDSSDVVVSSSDNTKANVTLTFNAMANYVFDLGGALSKDVIITVDNAFIPNQATYYVSNPGDDGKTGNTAGTAFASVQRAVDVINAYNRTGLTTINISGNITEQGGATGDGGDVNGMVLIDGGTNTRNILLQGTSVGDSIDAGWKVSGVSGLGKRVLDISGAITTVTLNNITITGGNAPVSDGAGGGIHLDGSNLVMQDNTKIIYNNAIEGGGVAVAHGATMTMEGGVISHNTASDIGGAVYVFDETGTNLTEMVIEGGFIFANTAGSNGGAINIHNKSTHLLTLKGGTISHNRSDTNGGAIYSGSNSQVHISGSPIVIDNGIGGSITGDTLGGETANNIYFENTSGTSSVKITGPLEIDTSVTPNIVPNIGLTPSDTTEDFMLAQNTGSHDFKITYFSLDDGTTGRVKNVNDLVISLVTMISITGTGSDTYTYQVGKSDESQETVENFYLGETEITQTQWKSVMGDTWATFDSSGGLGDSYPAYNISWYDAITFCNKLSIREGKTIVYRVTVSGADVNWEGITASGIPTARDTDWEAVVINDSANGYRLPTAIEWEYAAGHGGFNSDGSAKARTVYAGTDNVADLGDYAWYKDNSPGGSQSLPVKTKKANPLGLYDMSGNVREWYNDPSSPSSNSDRKFHSTDISSWKEYMEVTRISQNYAHTEYPAHGFRVARNGD